MVTATDPARPELAAHWHEAVAIVLKRPRCFWLVASSPAFRIPRRSSSTPDGTLHLLNEGSPSRWLRTQRSARCST